MRPVDKIYIPGRGEIRLDEYRVHRAVEQYDERLMFGRNEMTGDWCVFVKMPHGKAPVAVLGFGKEIPTPEQAVRRADEANTRKHGSEILNRMIREQDAYYGKHDKAVDEAAEIAAEVMAEGYRKMGAHPAPRVFMYTPKKSKVARGYQ